MPSRELVEAAEGLPPVLAGHSTPQLEDKVRGFYGSVAAMFEAWLARRKSQNTRRAYRRDVMDFVEFLDLRWPSAEAPQPDESWRLLQATVPDVQAWRDYMHDERGLAPNTLNRRVSSLSGFFRFLREAAAEMRLPITVPNPAHSQFIGREVQAPVSPTEALSAARARQLMALPEGETVLAYRDRALLKFYLYTGVRIATGCRLHVADFIDDDEDPKVCIQEKGRGKSKRVVGINPIAADALRQYIEHAGLTSGPLFRPRLNPRSEKLAERSMDVSTMYRLLQSYLTQLPRAMKEHELQDGTTELRCLYSPHSIRATTATLLLDQGEDIRDVQKLLGHKHVTVTQVYDKRRRGTKDSASHRLSL
ncbi:MAG: tyrosine-type recombinase/integrase [Polyangiaceae bacterium]|nr:tyrosine-type recombinase/integrase [Polyangiaceae bacterium]